jgi:CDP-diacylglycerol---glycerol-3-phosphate 3-phosphatidyltransferase
MLSERIRKWASGGLTRLARVIARSGVTPNTLTLIGFALVWVPAALLSQGVFVWGGVAVALASAFDALDGALARTTGRVTRFGAFLDSTLDRYSEALLYFGLLLYYVRAGATVEPLLIFAATAGSLIVSYARARAEGIGVQCKEGLFTRFERIVVLVVGLLLNHVTWALWLLAVLTNLTAVQRIAYVWRKTAADKAER